MGHKRKKSVGYDKALEIMGYQSQVDMFTSSTILAEMFGMEKEDTIEDLIEARAKARNIRLKKKVK